MKQNDWHHVMEDKRVFILMRLEYLLAVGKEKIGLEDVINGINYELQEKLVKNINHKQRNAFMSRMHWL